MYDKLEEVAHHINEQARNMEARKRVVDLQEETFADSCILVHPTRCFVMEGDLIKVGERRCHCFELLSIFFLNGF